MKNFLYVYEEELALELVDEGLELLTKVSKENSQSYWVFALDKLPEIVKFSSPTSYFFTNKMFF